MNLALAYAIDEIGVSEIPGIESNPRIGQYLRTVGKPGDDEIPWCAAFINWCLKQAGIKGTGKALARSFETWGEPLAEPEPGCIVVLKRGINPWQGHVGFFLDFTSNIDHIYVLSGNQSNRVSINAYSRQKVTTYRTHELLNKAYFWGKYL